MQKCIHKHSIYILYVCISSVYIYAYIVYSYLALSRILMGHQVRAKFTILWPTSQTSLLTSHYGRLFICAYVCIIQKHKHIYIYLHYYLLGCFCALLNPMFAHTIPIFVWHEILLWNCLVIKVHCYDTTYI